MGSGKLVLLLIAGSVCAGILAASATTHAMRTYPKVPVIAARPTADYARRALALGGNSSWIEDDLSALDIPAWPFGRDEWDGSDDAGQPDGQSGPASGMDQPPGAEPAGEPLAPGGSTAQDAAADAAARAEAAAADVTAAERNGS
ncbi:hypothetical protein [Novosphingobium beihaiensis]|uniref:Uncharacterized protein n=1 Tax=Novosphingobium beihaiensis TaxID=2930389 RepID=A0ABT0BNI0_9SPHN|nr:hypothetical protein [Novosphingobium beihaiensis]MCJ2186597.1 hypothetical protein [Novosphingobium beihaiensis]